MKWNIPNRLVCKNSAVSLNVWKEMHKKRVALTFNFALEHGFIFHLKINMTIMTGNSAELSKLYYNI